MNPHTTAIESLRALVISYMNEGKFEASRQVLGMVEGLSKLDNGPGGDGLIEQERVWLRQPRDTPGAPVISAIKSVRARTGLGLREAKEMCDAWKQRNGYV